MVTLNNAITIKDSVLMTILDGEAVLLAQESGKYYGLDAVGTRMWQLLGEKDDLQTVHAALLDEYEVDAARLQTDLLAFVERMAGYGLLTIA